MSEIETAAFDDFIPPLTDDLILSLCVQIVLLDEHTDLELVQAANPLLENFCAWQHSNHFTTDETDPGHYDLALLLTDIDICYTNNCDTLGKQAPKLCVRVLACVSKAHRDLTVSRSRRNGQHGRDVRDGPELRDRRGRRPLHLHHRRPRGRSSYVTISAIHARRQSVSLSPRSYSSSSGT